MFKTNAVSAKIREARIRKNMTQNALADEMAVSFQAVSNWERGASMPDISKLTDLCRILDISLYELLGESRDAELAEKVLEGGACTSGMALSDIAVIAPLLEPERLAELIKTRAESEVSMGDLISLSPFIDPETLESLADGVVPRNAGEIAALSPFISTAVTAAMIEKAESLDYFTLDTGLLSALCPFISREKADELAEKVTPDSLTELVAVAPFLSRTALEGMIGRLESIGTDELAGFSDLMPFISEKMQKDIISKMGS
ncbi:MAG: helix-turn-helix transcriptional regulator [Clostridia bacterium]|nr:helix-turn-helix transcriptional regulator [Clostridia bacterium]